MMRGIGEAIEDAVFESVGRIASRAQESRPLDADVLESDDAYLVVFDAPGATASDVDVQFDDDTVTVRIDRFRKPHEGYEMTFPGRGLTLRGRVRLPPETVVDPAGASATLTDNGTLRVEIPKVDTDPERIDIEGDSENESGAPAEDDEDETEE